MKNFARLIAFVAFVGVQSAVAQVTPTFTDIAYGDGHVRQMLDVYVPSGPSAPRPVVVWIHGGGWEEGDKSTAAFRAGPLMQLGFTVVGINYRLSEHAIFPAQIHDCKAAIRYLRANAATYNIDPNRIGVWGISAGAHLAALLGTSAGVLDAEGTVGGNLTMSSRVQAVVDFFGPTDFFGVEGWRTECDPLPPVALFLGACLGEIQSHQFDPEWADVVARAHLAGSVIHVTPDDPPFHIAHGSIDDTVWPEHSKNLFALLQAAGVPSVLRIVEGAGHGLPLSEDPWARMFLVQRLITSRPPIPCAGDVNRDQHVNAADLSVVLSGFGRPTPSGENGDLNGDAIIDAADLSVLLATFGDGC